MSDGGRRPERTGSAGRLRSLLNITISAPTVELVSRIDFVSSHGSTSSADTPVGLRNPAADAYMVTPHARAGVRVRDFTVKCSSHFSFDLRRIEKFAVKSQFFIFRVYLV